MPSYNSNITTPNLASSPRRAERTSISAVFNLEELRGRCMGNVSLVERILARFRQRMPDELQELQTALERDDAEQVARIAHRLKGTAASVSAKDLQHAAAQLEDISRTGRVSDIRAGIERVNDEWTKCGRVLLDGTTDIDEETFPTTAQR